MRVLSLVSVVCVTLTVVHADAQNAETPTAKQIDQATAQCLPQVVSWRRELHQHPELSNREVNTA
jgi:hypothetical protein